MTISRRTFTQNMAALLLTFLLVKSVDKLDARAHTVSPIVRKWLVEMEHLTQQLRQRQLKSVGWQSQIESLLSRVEFKDLLLAIDFDRLAKTAVFPEDHESAEDVEFSHNEGLPGELSFAPYFYAMKKGTAIVPHGHRNMASMHMMLKGRSHCWQFERVSDEAQYLTIKATDDILRQTNLLVAQRASRNVNEVMEEK